MGGVLSQKKKRKKKLDVILGAFLFLRSAFSNLSIRPSVRLHI